MTGALWIGRNLFLGRTMIGRVEKTKDFGGWLAFSYLPGAASLIDRNVETEAAAKGLVERSAESRCRAMFDAPIQTTVDAVHEGRELRKVARAIWKAGVWRCDRKVKAHEMFADLGRALGFQPEEAPRPNTDASQGSSSAEPSPDTGEAFDPIEKAS